MPKNITNAKKATKRPAKKAAPKSVTKAAPKPAPKPPSNKANGKAAAKVLHLKGLEILATLALKASLPAQAGAAGIEGEDDPNLGNMSPAEAVIWALNRAVGPPFGPNDSVSGLGITSNGHWESLANDLHTARNPYTLNGAQTRSRLPAAPGDTVSALVGVVSANS